VDDSDILFADQLISAILTDGGGGLRRTAEWAGVQMQSLSRFVGEDRERGQKQTGLEPATLERLWTLLDLTVARYSVTGEIVWVAQRASFAEQLRESIQSSGVKHVEIAKGSGVSKSSLSLFMSRKREGVSFQSIERLWAFLRLRILTRGESRFSLKSDEEIHDHAGQLLDDLDDGLPFIY
jgi:hypothetical protein